MPPNFSLFQFKIILVAILVVLVLLIGGGVGLLLKSNLETPGIQLFSNENNWIFLNVNYSYIFRIFISSICVTIF